MEKHQIASENAVSIHEADQEVVTAAAILMDIMRNSKIDQEISEDQPSPKSLIVRESPMKLNAWTQTSNDIQYATRASQAAVDFKTQMMAYFVEIEKELRAQSGKIDELSLQTMPIEDDFGIVANSGILQKYKPKKLNSPSLNEVQLENGEESLDLKKIL